MLVQVEAIGAAKEAGFVHRAEHGRDRNEPRVFVKGAIKGHNFGGRGGGNGGGRGGGGDARAHVIEML